MDLPIIYLTGQSQEVFGKDGKKGRWSVGADYRISFTKSA